MPKEPAESPDLGRVEDSGISSLRDMIPYIIPDSLLETFTGIFLGIRLGIFLKEGLSDGDRLVIRCRSLRIGGSRNNFHSRNSTSHPDIF